MPARPPAGKPGRAEPPHAGPRPSCPRRSGEPPLPVPWEAATLAGLARKLRSRQVRFKAPFGQMRPEALTRSCGREGRACWARKSSPEGRRGPEVLNILFGGGGAAQLLGPPRAESAPAALSAPARSGLRLQPGLLPPSPRSDSIDLEGLRALFVSCHLCSGLPRGHWASVLKRLALQATVWVLLLEHAAISLREFPHIFSALGAMPVCRGTISLLTWSRRDMPNANTCSDKKQNKQLPRPGVWPI